MLKRYRFVYHIRQTLMKKGYFVIVNQKARFPALVAIRNGNAYLIECVLNNITRDDLIEAERVLKQSGINIIFVIKRNTKNGNGKIVRIYIGDLKTKSFNWII